MRTAILSLHSHSDRSFLDDRDLAVLSGELRQAGFENDLVVVVLDEQRGETKGVPNERVLDRLIERLASYDVVAYQRIFSMTFAQVLRERLPDKVLVMCAGEHPVTDPPVDYVCRSLEALLAWLPTRRGAPPLGAGPPLRAFAPNLMPIYVNEDAFPAFRPFTVLGNEGCPYQADARENPIYQGVVIPESYGRGCAFCTAGNHYEHRVAAGALESVLEQLRYLGEHGHDRRHFVLKDQNPFGYLTELIEACARLSIRPFTLLVETRADWFLKNERRFARALEVARGAGYEIAPYLVGIESFSQAELDRFNKGTTVENNELFLSTLWKWKAEYGDALCLEHASFGFVLFTPWTELRDLRASFDAIERTRFHELRGKILLSRARLYPDNALYHLAARDGLLAAAFESKAEDNAVRFGYLPAQPWRFLHADVARFSELATELAEASGGRDELALFRALLEAFEGAAPHEVTAADVRARIRPGRVRNRGAHEWKLHAFDGDALEERMLGRLYDGRADPRPFDVIESELADLEGVHRIVLTGGRPTRHPRVREIAALARGTGARHLTLETDGGALADANVLSLCRETGVDELFVHVASLRDDAHDAVLREGDVRTCLQGLVRACESGIATYAVIPIGRANGKGVLTLVEWMRRLPVRPAGVLLAWPDWATLTPHDRTTVLPPRVLAKLVARVFEKCRAHSLEHGFRSRRGISACATAGALDPWGTVFHDRQMFLKRSDGSDLVRVASCAECSLQDSCGGIERTVVELFGEEGLASVPLEVSMDWKLKDLNSLGRREYKNVSPFKNEGGGEPRGLLRVNGHCNMSCAFCFVDRTVPDFETLGLLAEVDRMTSVGTRHIVLSGGEPTLHPDLPRLISHAKERGATTIEIQTNGVRAASLDYATELVDAGLNKATVSLHSANPEHSNRITRLPNAFEKTVRALHNFRTLGVETQVAHVITKSNYTELPGTMRFLASELPASDAHLSVCLAIAQGISDLVYTWVVPSFSEIRPYVREALDICLENEIGFGGMIGQGGYPPCMLDGKLEYYTRAYEHLYISDDWQDQFYKAPKCKECAFDPHCLGVRKAYVETYGDDEIRPFAAPASALPRTQPFVRASAPSDLVTLRTSRG